MSRFARLIVSTILLAMPVATIASTPQSSDPSWERLASKLRGVAETYKKWGITFEVKQAAFSSAPGFCPSTFIVSGGMESPDTFKMDIDTELGRKEALAVGISGTYKIGPDGHALSGKGTMFIKGSGQSIEFAYNNVDGFVIEAGLEEAFYSVGVKIGGDGKSPLSLGLKLGPATIKIDPVKYVNRCIEVGPEMARAASNRVGGVLIRTDLEFLAAALSNAPPPSTLRLRDVTVVSLKRLLRSARGRGGDVGSLTSVLGVATDSENSDVVLIGRSEPGMPHIPVSVLSALFRSIWKDGLEPFVSLDPAADGGAMRLKPRTGGLSAGLNKSALVDIMLSADYRMKSILYGDIAASGITPIPTALSRSTGIYGTGNARFWFTPRPLDFGDVGVIRSNRGVLTTFDVQPMVLTEKMTHTFGQASSDLQGEDPMERLLRKAATEFTREYPTLERSQPTLHLKQLRQVFELATAAAILRKQKPGHECAALLDRVAALQVAPVDMQDTYVPIRKTFQSASSEGMIQLWGGVTSGSARVASAHLRVEKSLGRVLDGIQTAQWNGSSVTLRGVFDPVIADAEPLDRAEVAQSHVTVAEQYLRERSFAQALGELNRAIELNDLNPHVYLLRCVAHYNLNDLGSMIADADRAVKLAPKDAKGYYFRAYGEMDFDRLNQAMADLAEAIRLAPIWSDPYVVRGNIKIGFDPRGAIADFDMALKYARNPSASFALRGLAHLKLNDKKAAIEDFSAAIRADSRNVGPYENRAKLLAEREDYAAALEDRKMIAGLRPTAEHFADLAVAKVRTKDFRGAIDDANRVIELDPKSWRGFQSRGRALMELGQFSKAIEDYTTAMALSPAYMRGIYEEEIEQCRKKIAENP
jgi:tetratricopeptide (TPR) repeat protein